ncbi:pyridoxal phosphate-dependent aminotransferase [Acetobacterium bakii]|uniref:Aminotransferase n=1 Tax=Acetobacterium bakii TaxID=52689 RepID=A0A0L6TYD2_9FIRM|nr:threonine-phosphate decarboxylase [Acetobacterium bakii]KNZ41087.1 L-threonine-O-3-phosphate decarboxylase [Acetobacterium bakii]
MNKHGGYRGENPEMLDFSVNINPLGIPAGIKEQLIGAIDGLVTYPEITGKTTIEKLAADIGANPENIILGNGAIELIYLFARSHKPGKALIIQPTFNEYERALKLYGWEVEHFILAEKTAFTINPAELSKTIEIMKPKVVFLCNPNNPTGRVYSRTVITELIEKSPNGTLWFLDESFMDFTTNEDGLSLIDNQEHPVFLLRSLTKFYALPGLRIGYGVGNRSIVKAMEVYKEPWTINALGLIAAAAVYDERGFKQKTREYIDRERQRVYNELIKIETVKVYKSDADFHLCRLIKGTVKDLQGYLETQGINIRTCEDFMGLNESYFRIAIKKEENNCQLLACLKEWRG